MMVLWGLCCKVSCQYIHRNSIFISFVHRIRYDSCLSRQIFRELKFPPFQCAICNILDWIPAPLGKSRRLFFAICDLPSQKRVYCTSVKRSLPSYIYREPVCRDARAQYNRSHNDLVVQSLYFTTMCKMRLKVSMILERNLYINISARLHNCVYYYNYVLWCYIFAHYVINT